MLGNEQCPIVTVNHMIYNHKDQLVNILDEFNLPMNVFTGIV